MPKLRGQNELIARHSASAVLSKKMGEVNIKTTCNRCRALKWLSGATPECLLGHSIDIAGPAPLEPCEKPLTYLDFIEARRDAQYAQNENGRT